MSSPRNTTNTGEAGVALVQLLVNVDLGWYFRTQLVDVGIDAQIEVVLDGVASGRLLGLQVKAGASMFKERAPDGDGWVYRENTQTHRRYWRRYQVPVLLVLCDLETRTAYWQLINAETAEVTGTGFKVIVPADQRLDAWARQTLANLARYAPADQFDESLRDLPAMCAASLSALMDRAPDVAQEVADGLLNGPSDPGTVVHKLSAAGSAKWHWLAWVALADYAAEHGLNTLAADCFLRAEERLDDSTLMGRYRAYAGILLIDSAPERAQSLLVESSASRGGALLGAIGLALLAHGCRRSRKTGSGPLLVMALAAVPRVHCGIRWCDRWCHQRVVPASERRISGAGRIGRTRGADLGADSGAQRSVSGMFAAHVAGAFPISPNAGRRHRCRPLSEPAAARAPVPLPETRLRGVDVCRTGTWVDLEICPSQPSCEESVGGDRGRVGRSAGFTAGGHSRLSGEPECAPAIVASTAAARA